jgi:hypothetical protein
MTGRAGHTGDALGRALSSAPGSLRSVRGGLGCALRGLLGRVHDGTEEALGRLGAVARGIRCALARTSDRLGGCVSVCTRQ